MFFAKVQNSTLEEYEGLDGRFFVCCQSGFLHQNVGDVKVLNLGGDP